MLTLFPTPVTESPKQEPNPTPRRLQYLPIAMLVTAGILELAARHHSAVGHAAPNPLPAKFSAGLPAPPAGPAAAQAAKPVPAVPKVPTRHEIEKARAAKARALETYSSPQFGISLSYPRTYALTEAEAIADDPNPLLQQSTDGSPAQQLLARIELPDNLYPRTDFLAGYVNLSVNPALTREQCAQAPGSADASERRTLEINGLTWTHVQSSGTIDATSMTWREYRAFSGSTCYEVELGVVTVNDGTITPVNQDRVFLRLENVLRTLKIVPTNPTEPTP